MQTKIYPLDMLFSEFIRKRSGGYCQRCGKPYMWQNLQCAHFIGRRYQSVRYNSDNAVALCFTCHQYLDSHPLDKTDWFKRLLGDTAFNVITSSARIYSKLDKEAITAYLKNELEKMNGSNTE